MSPALCLALKLAQEPGALPLLRQRQRRCNLELEGRMERMDRMERTA
jgi:hypothetical protein